MPSAECTYAKSRRVRSVRSASSCCDPANSTSSDDDWVDGVLDDCLPSNELPATSTCATTCTVLAITSSPTTCKNEDVNEAVCRRSEVARCIEGVNVGGSGLRDCPSGTLWCFRDTVKGKTPTTLGTSGH